MDGDDQPGRTEPALHGAGVEKGLLHRMEVVPIGTAAGQTLDGDDRGAIGLSGGHQAGAHQDVVQQDGAGAALALLAGVLRAPELESLAQDVEQALAAPDVVDLVLATVDREAQRHRCSPSSDAHTHPRQRRASTASVWRR